MKPIPNKWESDYERDVLWPRFLAKEIIGYHFEGVKLRLADNTFYTPDYFVIFHDHFECHEVKGFWRDDARVKIKVAAEKYNFFKFVAVTRKSKKAPWTTEEIGR